MAEKTYILGKSISGEQRYAGRRILTYRIDYPQFTTHMAREFILRINGIYREKAIRLAKEIRERHYQKAAQDLMSQTQQGTPFTPHQFEQTYVVTYDLDCIISLYFEQSILAGGVQSEKIRTSDTWNTASGRRILLWELFPGDADYQRALLEQVYQGIGARPQEFSGPGDYRSLAEQNFSDKNFYMTQSALVVYYQDGQIGPSTSGTAVFTIPYRQLSVVLPNC
jgi:hypothetical protein